MKNTAVLSLAFAACAAFGQLNIQPEVRYLGDTQQGKWKATIAYIVFKGDTPVVELANKTLLERSQRLLDEFLTAARASVAAGRPGLEAKTSASISLTGTQLISGVQMAWSYTGGAHGNSFALPYNFAMVAGQPKALGFNDIFKPGTGATVSDRVLAKLHGNERASYVASGEVTQMTQKQLDRFVITREGVKFFFDAYELAPYVNGAFNVTLLHSEIKDVIQPQGPLRLVPPVGG